MSKKRKKPSGRPQPREQPCPRRSAMYGRPMPHRFTSTKRVKVNGEWSAKEIRCCGCSKLRGPALPDTLTPILEASRLEQPEQATHGRPES